MDDAATPTVCNLTRNIVVRSENPDPTTGTPGHTANIGPDTHRDIRNNLLIGLGRTTNARIDRTSPDLSHIGTNQIARYGSHEHFAFGFGSTFSHNVVLGNRVAKWGVVVHQTHDTTVEDNIVADYAGAGFITEDGVEVRNVFRRNLAAYNLETVARNNTTTNLTEGRPGTEGTGYWFHGVQQVFEDNEARNNRIGSSFVNQLLAAGSYPSQPGLQPDRPTRAISRGWRCRSATPATRCWPISSQGTSSGASPATRLRISCRPIRGTCNSSTSPPGSQISFGRSWSPRTV